MSNAWFPKKKNSRLRPLDDRGFAYVMVMAAVVVMAILAEAAVVLSSYEAKRDREAELLFRGMAYQRAIQSYYLSSPSGVPSYPHNLEDLVLDPRYPGHKRYLRALYTDPMGKDWNLLKGPGGVIMGVASSSPEKPLKQDGFPPVLANFAGAQHYSDWIFQYQPNQPAAVSATGNAATNP